MPTQSFFVGFAEFVSNMIFELVWPTASRAPSILKKKFPPIFIVTPGSIVKVTPEETNTLLVTKYGLFAFVQVVFEEITPETCV